MNAQHTPGLLHTKGLLVLDGASETATVRTAAGDLVAEFCGSRCSAREDFANAMMFMGAQDMVAALRLAEERLVAIEHFTSQSSRVTVAAIRAAIAKATGAAS